MKMLIKLLAASALALLMLAAGISAAMLFGLADIAMNPLTVQIDDMTWSSAAGEHGLLAGLAIAVAVALVLAVVLALVLVVVLGIVPAALLFGLCAVALSVGGVFVAGLLVLTLLLAPLWLPALIVWRLWHGPARKPAPGGPATIHP